MGGDSAKDHLAKCMHETLSGNDLLKVGFAPHYQSSSIGSIEPGSGRLGQASHVEARYSAASPASLLGFNPILISVIGFDT